MRTSRQDPAWQRVDRSSAPPGAPAAPPAIDATSGDLRRLIDAEARNDQVIREARAAAAETIRAAHDAIAVQQAGLAAELERIVAEQASALAAERDRRMADLAGGAARDAAGYDAVTAERITAAARAVVDRLVGGDLA